MSKVVYRGVEYNTDQTKENIVVNWLPIIREQIKKQKRIEEAQLQMAIK
jgi:hypothetical protein